MGVVVDVVLAIAMIAFTSGAVTELQLRIGNVGAAAYSAFVGIVGSSLLGGKGNRSCLFLGSCLFGATTNKGEQIQNILACKEQIIAQSNQREQIVREKRGEIINLNANQNKIDKTQEPCLYGEDKENKKLAVREPGCKG